MPGPSFFFFFRDTDSVGRAQANVVILGKWSVVRPRSTPPPGAWWPWGSKAEHVAIWATNVPQWVILQFATARIGAVLVTINPAYRPFELEYVLRQSDAVALFLVDRFKSSDYFAMLAEVCPELAAGEPGHVATWRRFRRFEGS